MNNKNSMVRYVRLIFKNIDLEDIVFFYFPLFLFSLSLSFGTSFLASSLGFFSLVLLSLTSQKKYFILILTIFPLISPYTNILLLIALLMMTIYFKSEKRHKVLLFLFCFLFFKYFYLNIFLPTNNSIFHFLPNSILVILFSFSFPLSRQIRGEKKYYILLFSLFLLPLGLVSFVAGFLMISLFLLTLYLQKRYKKVFVIIASIIIVFSMIIKFIPHNREEEEKLLFIEKNILNKYNSIYSVPDDIIKKSYRTLPCFFRTLGWEVHVKNNLNEIYNHTSVCLSGDITLSGEEMSKLGNWVMSGGKLFLFVNPNEKNYILLQSSFKRLDIKMVEVDSVAFLFLSPEKFNEFIFKDSKLWLVDNSFKYYVFNTYGKLIKPVILPSSMSSSILTGRYSEINSFAQKIDFGEGEIVLISNPESFNVGNLFYSLKFLHFLFNDLAVEEMNIIRSFLSIITIFFGFLILLRFHRRVIYLSIFTILLLSFIFHLKYELKIIKYDCIARIVTEDHVYAEKLAIDLSRSGLLPYISSDRDFVKGEWLWISRDLFEQGRHGNFDRDIVVFDRQKNLSLNFITKIIRTR